LICTLSLISITVTHSAFDFSLSHSLELIDRLTETFFSIVRASSENSNSDSQEALLPPLYDAASQETIMRLSAEPMEWGSVTPSPRGTPEHPGGGSGGPLDNCSAGSGDTPIIKDYLPQEFPGSSAVSTSANFADPVCGSGAVNTSANFADPVGGLDNRKQSNPLVDG
jgi:hypothetical protein